MTYRHGLPPSGLPNVRHSLDQPVLQTPDSAPMGLTQSRSVWVAPSLLLLFAGLTVLLRPTLPSVLYAYERIVSHFAGLNPSALTTQSAMTIRPLIVVLFALIALFGAGRLRDRLLLLGALVLTTSAATLVLDILLAREGGGWAPSPFSTSGSLLVALIVVFLGGLMLLLLVSLPSAVIVRTRFWRPKRNVSYLLGASVCALVLTLMAQRYGGDQLKDLARVPMLGGTTSSILVFLSLLYVLLFVIGTLRERPHVAVAFPPSVGFLIPARNEEASIGACVRSADAAAAQYEGICAIYVVENGSTDGTFAAASESIRLCEFARGYILQAPPEGKARALNVALAAAVEDIVVRVDADTGVSADVLARMAEYFEDQNIGGVSGLPLPHGVSTWLERMRAIEVYYNVAYKRVGQGLLDAITVLPGAMVAYRRDALVRLGGFAEGMNGEDADMTVRVGRLGYRIVSDPRITATTGTPGNLAELREQRLRWSRGLYHMLGRNWTAIPMAQGIRGTLLLPWACFNNFHKLVLIPFVVAGVAVASITHSISTIHGIAAAAVIALGFQLAQMAITLVAYRQYDLFASLPGFVIFRLIVSYYGLEALLTLRIGPSPLRRHRTPTADVDATRVDHSLMSRAAPERVSSGQLPRAITAASGDVAVDGGGDTS